MSHRYLGTALAVIAVVALAPALSAAQSTDASTTPRTPWGAPDLGGVWDFRTTTPLERPDELEGKTELTAEEAPAQKARAREFPPAYAWVISRRLFDRDDILERVRVEPCPAFDEVQVLAGAAEVACVREIGDVDDECLALPPAA